jgi:hypothetical protein
MSRLSLHSLRQHRRLIAAPGPVWFLIGVLFAGQLPGEPLHTRLLLVALLFLAFFAGVLHHSIVRDEDEQ